MKKLLVLYLLFLCSFLPIFAADSAPVILSSDEACITAKIQNLLYNHFPKEKSKPIGLVRPKHEHFNNNPDVFAFYNPEDNYIYFRDKDIVNKLNDKYTLNSVIHELTHFYQNNYGNKLPEGGTPGAIANLMLNFEGESVFDWKFETAYKNIVNRAESEIYKLAKKIKELEKQRKFKPAATYRLDYEIKKIEALILSWREAQDYVANGGWEKFKKAAIAEGTACLMGTKCSGTFYVTDASYIGNFFRNDGHYTNTEIYLYIFIPITIKEHYDNSNNEGKNFWYNFYGIYTNAGYKRSSLWAQEEWDNELQNVLKNIERKDILKLIERRTEK